MTQRVALPFFGLDPLPWPRPAGTGFPTWLNQQPAGLSAATLTDNTGGLPLVLSAKQDSASLYFATCALKAKGVAPWTVKTGQAAFSPFHLGIGATYPLVFYNSGSDLLLALNWTLGQAPDSGRVTLLKITNATAGAGSVVEIDSGFGFSSVDYFEWFRVDNDGTNLNFFLSPEGQLWFPIYSIALVAFIGTIDKIGFGVERLTQNNAGASPGNNAIAAVVWSWVES